MTEQILETRPEKTEPVNENKLHKNLVRLLLVVMTLEGAYLLYNQQWLSLFLIILIIITLLAPVIFRSQLNVILPAELHLSAVVFSFAALYLGELQQFYERLWWWDIALHTTAGLMMGIVGFLLVYILNETDKVRLTLTAGFIAFFAFLFAISIGTFWEIFEFAMDELFLLNMQKPMLGDPSGLTDTMWDMIVNAAGALTISLLGWRYLKNEKTFIIGDLIQSFISRNPSMFKGEKKTD